MTRIGTGMRVASLLVTGVFATAPAPAAELLIRGARVHTLGPQGTLDSADVRIREGRVVEVGQGLTAGADAAVVEANGRPLTPGLFGGITALGVSEISLEPSTVDNSPAKSGGAAPLDVRPELDVTVAFNPASAVIGVNRIEGITFAMVAPEPMPGGAILAGEGSVARLDGRWNAFAPEARTLFVNLGPGAAAGSGLARAAQYTLLRQASREARPDKSMREGDFRLLTPDGRDVLARYLAGGRIAFAVDRAADIRQVMAFAASHRVRPVIVGGAQAWQVANELADAKVPVILDPLRNLPGTFDQLGARLDNAAILARTGVPIAFTQFVAPTHNAHKVRQAAGVAVAHGLPWDAALSAITRTPAEIFGLGTELGRIEVGYAADLVLWSGDPLEVTTVAEQVWIDGRPQPMRSRQTELRDRYRPASAR